jgi:transposase
MCSHLRGRGLRSPVLRERPSGYLSTLILLHEPGESNLNTHLQVGRKPKKKEPSSVCRRGGDGGNTIPLTRPFQRGRTYGTILVDLQSHRPVDLLADRSADTFSRWLLSHPGVEVISRDRSTEYLRGATEGAPGAQQVIDRWHLLKNLREALERLLPRLHEGLAALPAASNEGVAARPRQRRTRAEGAASTASRLRRLARYEQVVQLSHQGASIIGIARQLHISRQTVRKYVQAGTFPEQARAFRTKSRLDPYLPFLQQRWEQGCRSANTLWQELLAGGFPGGYMLVYRWVQLQREATEAMQANSLEAALLGQSGSAVP